LRHKRRKARAKNRVSKYKRACVPERYETTKKFVSNGVGKRHARGALTVLARGAHRKVPAK
jgi:hypothetical protein